MDIYTIGHSTHTIEKFISILKTYHIETLIDIRSYPGSKFVPQFNKGNMEKWLPDNDINYIHMPELGGRRKSRKEINESLINGWEKISFRNYAAYSLTDEYNHAINKLISIAERERVCCMCAEGVPWRCHRLIISNTLVSKGFQIYHIMTGRKTITHELGKYGTIPVIEGSKLIYPKEKISK